jgi:hypothetical protein
VFLEPTGLEFTARPAHAAAFVQALDDSFLDEVGFATWLRDTTRRRSARKQSPYRRKKQS